MLNQPRISAIAAIGKNRELGKNNSLIWKFEEDFKHLKKIIKGHTLIMGRKTYESIGCELPSPSVVVTRDLEYKSPYKKCDHTFVVNSLNSALAKASDIETQNDLEKKEVFIFGGSQIYQEALPQTNRLYLTLIDKTDPEADSFFPDYSEFTREIENREVIEKDTRLNFLTLER